MGPAIFSIIALAMTFAVFETANSYLVRRIDIGVLSAFFSMRGALKAPEDLVIVSIDDNSYKTLEASTNYPLPRSEIATALETIASAAPKLVLLDLKIPAERAFDPAADARIVAAIERVPATIWSGKTGGSVLADLLPSDSPFRKAAKMELDMLVAGTAGFRLYVADPHELGNEIPVEVVRKESPESVKAALYRRAEIAKPLIELANFPIKVPAPHSLINFYGPSETINRISLVDFIRGDIEESKEKIRGKVVLVGYQSLQYGKGSLGKDEFPVPVEDNGMFGVEIHANIVANLIHGNWLRRLKPVDEVTIVCGLVCLMALIALRKPTPLVIGFLVCSVLLLFVLGYLLFSVFNFFVSGLGTLAAMVAVIVAVSVVYFNRRTQKFERYLKKTFDFETEREI